MKLKNVIFISFIIIIIGLFIAVSVTNTTSVPNVIGNWTYDNKASLSFTDQNGSLYFSNHTYQGKQFNYTYNDKHYSTGVYNQTGDLIVCRYPSQVHNNTTSYSMFIFRMSGDELNMISGNANANFRRVA